MPHTGEQNPARMSQIVSINGEIFDGHDAKISIFDHCFLYGDGIFEGLRFINKKILFHAEHLKRLYRSAEVLRLPMRPKEEYERQLFQAVKVSGLNSGYIRVVVTRGVGDLGINPSKCMDSKLVIVVTNLQLYPAQTYEEGLKVIVARTKKISAASFNCRVKSCNYLTNIMATWEFIDRGAAEAIMTDEHGIVCEATVENIFGVNGKTLFTPDLDTNCLEGITRNKIIEIANGQGLDTVEGKFTVHDFMLAGEVFLTGTGAGIVPITQIEYQTIGTGTIGPTTRLLRNVYESQIERFCTAVG